MNKRRKMQKYLVGLWIFLLAACQEERLEQGFQGGFQIALSEMEAGLETRTAPKDLPEPVKTGFKVTIRNEETNTQQTAKWSEKVIPADPGTYTLTAEYGENPDLGFDQPYYKGEKTGQTVNEGATTKVTIPCEVANALVSIRIKEEDQAAFKQNFPEAYVKIGVGSVKDQMWTDLGKSAYFKAGSTLSQLILYKGNESGELDLLKAAAATVPNPFQAKDHLIITLSLQGQTGNLSLAVEKAEVKEETIAETIPVEWLPKPKVEAEGFVNNTLTFVETETPKASIRFNTASALQDMKLKFDFADEQFSSLTKEEYLLSDAEDKQAVETALGITLPTIGTEKASLDLSPLIAKLQTNTGVATSNSIEIDAKANNRWSSEDKEANRTYTLVCNKPEFTVSAYPGNIWTKEFTMNALMEDQVTKGDFSKLSANMKYQFSTNGESDWTDLGEDLRKADLTPGTTYYIRGVYRGVVCSEPVAVSTYPVIELENGGLEGSSIIKGADKNDSEYGAMYAWNGWSTLNELTCDKCTIFLWAWGNTAFNSRSGTRPSSDIPEGSTGSSSAWIMTMGYGFGNWDGPKSYTPSELFLGSYSNGKNYGIPFSSRPDKLSFYYKYYPYNNDKSDIYIQIKGKNDELLGSASLNEINTVDQFSQASLEIKYDETYKNIEPETLIIVFKSGFNTDVKDYGTGSKMGSNSAEPSHRGSELYIDDISLVYDK